MEREKGKKMNKSNRMKTTSVTVSQLRRISVDFKTAPLSNEDDVKINFYASYCKASSSNITAEKSI